MQNFPELVVSHHSSIALEGLLERAKDLVQVEIIGQALDSSEALATAATLAKVGGRQRDNSPSLLHSHVDLPQVAIIGLVERVCRESAA